jgi:hypothetical protein
VAIVRVSVVAVSGFAAGESLSVAPLLHKWFWARALRSSLGACNVLLNTLRSFGDVRCLVNTLRSFGGERLLVFSQFESLIVACVLVFNPGDFLVL